MLYNLQDSYLWQCKREVLSVIDKLKGKNIFNHCKVLEEFQQYLEEKKQKQMRANDILGSGGRQSLRSLGFGNEEDAFHLYVDQEIRKDLHSM